MEIHRLIVTATWWTLPWVGQGELIKDGVPRGLAVVSPLLQTCDGVSSLGVIQHDLLGIGVVPAASQVDVVQEEVINSSLDHLWGGGRGNWKLHTQRLVITQ